MGERYLVALGSNQRHHRHGSPRAVLVAALAALERSGMAVLAASPIIASRPLGPSQRTYANAAAIVEAQCEPPELLERLQAIEAAFGRRRRGQRWRARVLDLDLVLWAGGCWSEPGLTVPHPAYRERAFVLVPARAVARNWRDPLSGRTVQQLHARLTRRHGLPKARQSLRCAQAGP